ncbi:MAG: hypothetical protein E7263_09825 [Lachnospiraceae bacterium]|nr:hypothetical protein [Lachnospiraceae bacterium]
MKRICLLCIAMTLLLSGCNGQKDIETTTVDGSSRSTEITQTQEDINMEFNVDYINKVTTIQVVDVVDGVYKEDLCIDITKDDVEKLKGIQIPQGTGNMMGEAGFIYKLNMLDENGNVIAFWNIAITKQILDHNGQLISKDGELKEWIKSIEKTYNISTKVYDRTPGTEYFSDLKNIKKGGGEEVVDYYEGLEYIKFELDEDDIVGLQSLTDTICVDEEPKVKIKDRDDLYYRLDVYTNTDGSYEFYVMYDGTIYIQTKQTYQVIGDGVEEYFRKLESKYGLDKINK